MLRVHSLLRPSLLRRLPQALASTRASQPCACRIGHRLMSTAASEEATESFREDIRNIAIVAHVDHGKTTLVDAMLQESRAVDKSIGKDERLMDSNDQERERGITILAKNAAVNYEGIKINIVDTPGHADFGGEVERVLNMVDGVLLLVDAKDGPKPQTRFVLKKAIAMGHRILVVINKIDKPDADPASVVDKTFDLFCELGASDEQTDFPIVYTSAINRVAGDEPDQATKDLGPLFRKILDLPSPSADLDGSLQLQISNIANDNFIGRLGIGRIRSGVIRRAQQVGLSAGPGCKVESVKVTELFAFDAMGKTSVEEASAGDIVTFAGIENFNIGDTVVDLSEPRPLEPITVEQPTMSMTFGVNKSAVAGKVGKKLTMRVIKDRLEKELETNVALKMEDTVDADTVQVSGRGLLHLTVLIENMRREGYELMVGPPKVIEQQIDGARHEPFELVDIELPEEAAGSAIDLLNQRKGMLLDMSGANKAGMVTVQYEVPSRGMNGVKTRLLSATKGLAMMSTTFAGYKPYAGAFAGRDRGNLLSSATGTVTGHALKSVQERGELFSLVGDEVYENQIIGISAKSGDLKVNPCKAKQLTNMRAARSEMTVHLDAAKQLTLEDAVEYVVEGEFVEVTPEKVRMGVYSYDAKKSRQKV